MPENVIYRLTGYDYKDAVAKYNELTQSTEYMSGQTRSIAIGLMSMLSDKELSNTSATSSYRLLRTAQASGNVYDFKETDKDGTTITFTAYPSVKRGGGGVNGVIDFDLNLALASEITITDPSAA